MNKKVIIVEPRSKEEIIDSLVELAAFCDWVQEREINKDDTPVEKLSLHIFMNITLDRISKQLGFKNYEDLKEFQKDHNLVEALLED